MKLTKVTSIKNIGISLLALLAALPLIYAHESGRGGGSEARSAPAERSQPERQPAERAPVYVDRSYHGSIRHVDTGVTQRPASPSRDFGARQQVNSNRDVDVDVNVPRSWNAFSFGARRHGLGAGYSRILVNDQPYYYDDGIYYQQNGEGDDFQEVYPPVGADIPQPPDGAVEVDAGDTTYYYAGGAFYVQQQDGFVIVAPPIGVIVPELPPGAVEVSYNGGPAWQFNGVDYQPIFVNGVTQYLTVMPNAQSRRAAHLPTTIGMTQLQFRSGDIS